MPVGVFCLSTPRLGISWYLRTLSDWRARHLRRANTLEHPPGESMFGKRGLGGHHAGLGKRRRDVSGVDVLWLEPDVAAARPSAPIRPAECML